MAGEASDRPWGRYARWHLESWLAPLVHANWRWIVGVALLGGLTGFAIGLFGPKLYVSSATFIPDMPEAGLSDLALAASQFGIQVPMGGSGWGAPVYVAVLRSRGLLESVVLDSVPCEGERTALLDLLDVPDYPPAVRLEKGIIRLRKVAAVSEHKQLNAVKIEVTTKWADASLALVNRLVEAVERFNRDTRKTQATAERQFVEEQVARARQTLRESEDRLQTFLRQNRAGADSPDLRFQRERLEREVALSQTVYTSLVQNREEARIREVRDTPVITVIEEPRLSALGEPRRIVMKTVLGAALGTLLAMLVTYLRVELSRGRVDRLAAPGQT